MKSSGKFNWTIFVQNVPKAIKKLDINSLFSVNRLYQAYLENDILNELDSPYIVKIYGAFEADGKRVWSYTF